MILSVSLVPLLGVLIFFLIRYASLRVWQAVICIVFGFYLASSPMGPYIGSATAAVVHLISGGRS